MQSPAPPPSQVRESRLYNHVEARIDCIIRLFVATNRFLSLPRAREQKQPPLFQAGIPREWSDAVQASGCIEAIKERAFAPYNTLRGAS
jgi:hypothetical protein